MIIYIDEEDLKLNTNLNSNLDTVKIRPAIQKAQDIYISKFLGKELDTYLKDAIENETTTILDDELIEHLKKAQYEYTAYLCYVDILFNWVNKGALSGNAENASSINTKDLIYVRDIAKNQGDFYLNELKIFLELNSDVYTTFKKCSNETKSISSPFYFIKNKNVII